jgi:hypothetical protein
MNIARLNKILSDKKTIWYILLFGLVCRLVVVLSMSPLGDDTVDGFDYHNHAISLLEKGIYPAHGSLPFMRPPLYPFVLSFVYRIFPHETFLTARIFNVFLDIAACYVFYKLVILVWNNLPTANISSFIYVINPLFLFFCAKVRVEALFTLLVVVGAYILVKEYKSEFSNKWNVLFAGMIFGLAALCRSNATALVILLPLWLFYCDFPSVKKAALTAILFVVGSIVVISPWSLRNYQKFGEPILITDGFGYAFWISNTELKFDDLNARTHEEYLAADAEVWQSFAVVEEQIKDKSLKERDNYYFGLAKDYIKNNFSRWLWLNVLKSAEFWSPMARLDMQGWKAFLTLPFGLAMVLGMFFYLRNWFSQRFDKNILLLILVLIIASAGTGILTWSSVRFRVPLIDAYVIPFGIFWLQNKFKNRFPKPSDKVE